MNTLKQKDKTGTNIEKKNFLKTLYSKLRRPKSASSGKLFLSVLSFGRQSCPIAGFYS